MPMSLKTLKPTKQITKWPIKMNKSRPVIIYFMALWALIGLGGSLLFLMQMIGLEMLNQGIFKIIVGVIVLLFSLGVFFMKPGLIKAFGYLCLINAVLMGVVLASSLMGLKDDSVIQTTIFLIIPSLFFGWKAFTADMTNAALYFQKK